MMQLAYYSFFEVVAILWVGSMPARFENALLLTRRITDTSTAKELHDNCIEPTRRLLSLIQNQKQTSGKEFPELTRQIRALSIKITVAIELYLPWRVNIPSIAENTWKRINYSTILESLIECCYPVLFAQSQLYIDASIHEIGGGSSIETGSNGST